MNKDIHIPKKLSIEQYRELGKKGKVSKYRNKKVVVDGITFDSQKEARRWGELKMMERAGDIEYLTLQPSYDIKIDGQLVCRYRGDFAYKKRGCIVVEDCKGFLTPIYRLKKKLMKAILGIEIIET